MKKDFKQWKDDYGLEFEPNYSKETELDCKAAFEAGQQSKQSKVDELQKRIDDLKSFCIKGVESNMLSIEYNQALIDMHNILKGNTSEH